MNTNQSSRETTPAKTGKKKKHTPILAQPPAPVDRHGYARPCPFCGGLPQRDTVSGGYGFYVRCQEWCVFFGYLVYIGGQMCPIAVWNGHRGEDEDEEDEDEDCSEGLVMSGVWLYESGDELAAPSCQAVFRSEEKAQRFWEKSGLPAGLQYFEAGDWWHKMTRVSCDPLDVAALQAELNKQRRLAGVKEVNVTVASLQR